MPKVRFKLNGNMVVYSNVILWREVVNDAVVSEWRPLAPQIYPPTIANLHEWMKADEDYEGWKVHLMHKGIAHSRDFHVWEYGKHAQIWMPDKWDDENTTTENCIATCRDAGSLTNLTVGKGYRLLKMEGDLIRIVDDNNEENTFFFDRFDYDPVNPL